MNIGFVRGGLDWYGVRLYNPIGIGGIEYPVYYRGFRDVYRYLACGSIYWRLRDSGYIGVLGLRMRYHSGGGWRQVVVECRFI